MAQQKIQESLKVAAPAIMKIMDTTRDKGDGLLVAFQQTCNTLEARELAIRAPVQAYTYIQRTALQAVWMSATFMTC